MNAKFVLSLFLFSCFFSVTLAGDTDEGNNIPDWICTHIDVFKNKGWKDFTSEKNVKKVPRHRAQCRTVMDVPSDFTN